MNKKSKKRGRRSSLPSITSLQTLPPPVRAPPHLPSLLSSPRVSFEESSHFSFVQQPSSLTEYDYDHYCGTVKKLDDEKQGKHEDWQRYSSRLSTLATSNLTNSEIQEIQSEFGLLQHLLTRLAKKGYQLTPWVNGKWVDQKITDWRLVP